MPTPRRAAFIITNMAFKPLFGSPTSQPLRVIEVDHAGRVAVNAHLVLDGTALHAIALAGLAGLGSGTNFGTMKSEMPFVPFGASGRRASTR